MPLYRSLFVSGLFFVLTACSFSKNKNTKEESPGSPAPPIVIQAPETTKKIDTLFDAIDKLDGSAFDKLLTPMNFQQVNSYNSSGETPLYYAVKLNRFIFVKKLLEKGAMPLKLNSDGVSGPLQIGHDVNESIGELLDKKVEELEAQLKQMLNAQRWVEAGEFAEKTFQSKHGFFQDMVVKSLDPKKQSRDQLESDYRWQFVMSELEGGFLSNQSAYLLYKMSAVWGDAQLATAVVEKKLALFESDQSFIFENLRLNTSESWFLFTVSLSRSKNFLMENWYFHEGALRILNTNKFSIEKILELISSGISLKKGENYAVGSAIIRGLASNRSFVSNREATLKIIKEIKAQEAGELFPESFVFQTIEYYAGLAYLDAPTLAVFLADLNYFSDGLLSPISQVEVYDGLRKISKTDSRDKLMFTWIGSLNEFQDVFLKKIIHSSDNDSTSILRLLPRSIAPKVRPLFLDKLRGLLKNTSQSLKMKTAFKEKISNFYSEVNQWDLNANPEFVSDVFHVYLENADRNIDRTLFSPSDVLYEKYYEKFVEGLIPRDGDEREIFNYFKNEIENLKFWGEVRESRLPVLLSAFKSKGLSPLLKWHENIFLGYVPFDDDRADDRRDVRLDYGASLVFSALEIAAIPQGYFPYPRGLFGPGQKYQNVFEFLGITPEDVILSEQVSIKGKGSIRVGVSLEDYFDIFLNSPILEDIYCSRFSGQFSPRDGSYKCLIDKELIVDKRKLRQRLAPNLPPVSRPSERPLSPDFPKELRLKNFGFDEDDLKFLLVRVVAKNNIAKLNTTLMFEYMNNALNLRNNKELLKRYVETVKNNIKFILKSKGLKETKFREYIDDRHAYYGELLILLEDAAK